jgi:hypothetical protein
MCAALTSRHVTLHLGTTSSIVTGPLVLMTPHDIHYGLAAAKWQQRAAVLRTAYGAHPERFPRGVPVPPPLPTAAWINKPLSAPALAVPDGARS